jgi:flagella basal body P-ring formation protein FlgA
LRRTARTIWRTSEGITPRSIQRITVLALAVHAAAVGTAFAAPQTLPATALPAIAVPSNAAAAAASAANLAALPPGTVEQGLALLKQAAQALAPPGARVVLVAGAPDLRLKLAPCSAGTAYLLPAVAAWGASRLGLRCTQGAAWNIQLPVQVQIFAPAVVADTALSPLTTLSAAHLAVVEADWGAHGSPPAAAGAARAGPSLFSDARLLAGRVLLRPAAAGAPVKAADLQVRQWFAAGATVSVVAVGGGFSVGAEGQALSAGLEGQLVRVRTESGRVVAGLATGERRVEVRL